MKIATIGSGRIAGTLAGLWAGNGHELLLGARSVDKAQAVADQIKGDVMVGSYQEALAFSNVVLVALPWQVAQAVVTPLDWSSKHVVIDCMNPFENSVQGLAMGHTTSFSEQLADWCGAANVVKAFNHIFWEMLNRPNLAGQQVSAFFCGDNNQAKEVVSGLITDIGFESIDCGPHANARLLEPLSRLWTQLAFKYGYGTQSAFKLLSN